MDEINGISKCKFLCAVLANTGVFDDDQLKEQIRIRTRSSRVAVARRSARIGRIGASAVIVLSRRLGMRASLYKLQTPAQIRSTRPIHPASLFLFIYLRSSDTGTTLNTRAREIIDNLIPAVPLY